MLRADLTDVVDGLRALTTFDLEQPRYYGAPTFAAHSPGFHYTLHRRHEPGTGAARTSASGLIVTAEHSGTHIDALCHQAEDMRLFGDVAVTPEVQTSNGFRVLGAESIPPLVARGVLLDVARHAGVERLAPGHLVGAAELEACAQADGVEVRAGDVALIRTGNALAWEDPEAYLKGPGMGPDAAPWLAERRPLAVGADNVAFDVPGHVDPELGALPCHRVLIVRHGIYIIENLQLEALSSARALEFVFVCVPLKMRGVTGSPVRPLAFAPTSGGDA